MESVPDHIPTKTLGHKLSAYIRLTEYLHGHGIHVPEIYAADEPEGWILIEDFGSTSLYDRLEQGGDAMRNYAAATDELIHMRENITSNDLGLPNFIDGYIYNRRRRVVDWYMPATRYAMNEDGLTESYLSVWKGIEDSLSHRLSV